METVCRIESERSADLNDLRLHFTKAVRLRGDPATTGETLDKKNFGLQAVERETNRRE